MDQQITAVIVNRKEHKLVVTIVHGCPVWPDSSLAHLGFKASS